MENAPKETVMSEPAESLMEGRLKRRCGELWSPAMAATVDSARPEGDVGHRGDGPIQVKGLSMLSKVVHLFSTFDEQKRALVRETGFGGLLRIPTHATLDESLSYWLLKRLDIETMTFNLPFRQTLPIRDLDVHLVLGIPFVGQPVFHENHYDIEVVATVRRSLSLGGDDARLTLDYLEEVLTRDYGLCMLEEEKSCFKIAVVLFALAYFLAVFHPGYRFPLWLLRNFTDPSKIYNFNWSGYVLSVVAHAAKRVQEIGVSSGEIVLCGCTFMLQVFYLDNLKIGSPTSLQIDLPRASIFNPEYMAKLRGLDNKGDCGAGYEEFGKKDLRGCDQVCYTRGWNEGMKEELIDPTPEIVHDALASPTDVVKRLRADLAHLVVKSATAMKLNFCSLYPGYVPTAEPCITATRRPEGTFRVEDRRLHKSGVRIAGHVSPLATDQVKSDYRDNLESNGVKAPEFIWTKKAVVGVPMQFDKSPFDLDYYHPAIPRRKRMIMYNWFKNAAVGHDELSRVWFRHHVPTKLELTGHEIKSSFMMNGHFSMGTCKAVMRLFNHLDDWMYHHYGLYMKEVRKRWRHFLCPSFAEAVFKKKDFLNSDEIRFQFVGPHINYEIECCRMIVLPVLWSGKWSCYFWDFENKTVTVLDPTMQRMLEINVDFTHDGFVDALHEALFACINKFFIGWELSKDDWTRSYPTNVGPRCKMQNSGLNTCHYARAFDGDSLFWKLKLLSESNLGEPRSELLYFLLTMDGNQGYTPSGLKEQLDMFPKRRRGLLSMA